MIFITPKKQWYCTKCTQYNPELPPPEKPPGGIQRLDNSEYYGAMPDKYDVIFYTGVFVFIIMVFLLYNTRNGVTCLIMGVANIVSMYAVYLDIKNKKGSISGAVGNIVAILWIVFAWFLSLALWALFL